jgi:uncharacterized HAD superfamily protein
MKYSIDIDGVITDKLSWSFVDSYERMYKMLMNIKPNKRGIKAVNKLYNKGHIIILHTSRLWHDFKATTEWLKKHKVKYHTLVMGKPTADYYIDDKNLSMEEFLK